MKKDLPRLRTLNEAEAYGGEAVCGRGEVLATQDLQPLRIVVVPQDALGTLPPSAWVVNRSIAFAFPIIGKECEFIRFSAESIRSRTFQVDRMNKSTADG